MEAATLERRVGTDDGCVGAIAFAAQEKCADGVLRRIDLRDMEGNVVRFTRLASAHLVRDKT